MFIFRYLFITSQKCSWAFKIEYVCWKFLGTKIHNNDTHFLASHFKQNLRYKGTKVTHLYHVIFIQQLGPCCRLISLLYIFITLLALLCSLHVISYDISSYLMITLLYRMQDTSCCAINGTRHACNNACFPPESFPVVCSWPGVWVWGTSKGARWPETQVWSRSSIPEEWVCTTIWTNGEKEPGPGIKEHCPGGKVTGSCYTDCRATRLQCQLDGHHRSVWGRYHQIWLCVYRYPWALQPGSWYFYHSWDWGIWSKCQSV